MLLKADQAKNQEIQDLLLKRQELHLDQQAKQKILDELVIEKKNQSENQQPQDKQGKNNKDTKAAEIKERTDNLKKIQLEYLIINQIYEQLDKVTKQERLD